MSEDFNFMDLAMGLTMASVFSKVMESNISSAQAQMASSDIRYGQPNFEVKESQAKYIHVIIGGLKVGPLTFSDMVERIAKGEITPDTFLWKPGMKDWICAKDVEDIAPNFNVEPPKFNINEG